MGVRMKVPLLCLISFVVFIPVISSKNEKGNADFLRVCYYTVGNPPPNKLNTTVCTHIIAGFSVVKKGLLYLGDEHQKQLYRETTSLKKENPQLKVLLTVGGGGNDGGFSDAFNTTWGRTRFVASSLAVLVEYNFDGLDIDWEFPVWNDKNLNDKENFISFLEVYHALGKIYAYLFHRNPPLITVAVAAPENIVSAAYDIPRMAEAVDFINLMSYDFHDFFWYTPFTGHNSPLFNRTVEKAYFATLNTAWAANYWHDHGMPKSKIMVGVPTYGHAYQLSDPSINGVDAPSTGSNGDATFSQVCKLLASGGTRVFDEESQVPYAYLNHQWISYEDTQSISGKVKWIKSQEFGGAMTYNLNSDDWSGVCDKTPFLLHRTVYDAFINK